jgi:hypothetical protein
MLDLYLLKLLGQSNDSLFLFELIRMMLIILCYKFIFEVCVMLFQRYVHLLKLTVLIR